MDSFLQIKFLNTKHVLLYSQNRVEYDKRVRAQAKAMSRAE